MAFVMNAKSGLMPNTAANQRKGRIMMIPAMSRMILSESQSWRAWFLPLPNLLIGNKKKFVDAARPVQSAASAPSAKPGLEPAISRRRGRGVSVCADPGRRRPGWPALGGEPAAG